jgi:hypothetical protein
MKDQFERNLEEKRKGLDSVEPNTQAIWDGVERHLQGRRDHRRLLIWRVAAILLAFIAVAQLTYIITDASKPTPMQLTLVSEDSGAFQSLEASYHRELVMLEERLAKKAVSREEYALFFDEMDYIRELEKEFKEEILLTSDREKLAAILIDTYEKKIQLLERLLQQVERDERLKQEMKEGLMPMKKNQKNLAI